MFIYKFLAKPAFPISISGMKNKGIPSKNKVKSKEGKEKPQNATEKEEKPISQSGEEMFIQMEDKDRAGTAPIDFLKESTEAKKEGLTKLPKVFEALEKGGYVEEKRSPVEEIINDKENQSDSRPSLANVENKAILQDQKTPNSSTVSINPRARGQSISHSSVKNTGKSSDKQLKSTEGKEIPLQTPPPEVKEEKRTSLRQKRNEELEKMQAEIDLENAGKKKCENHKIDVLGSWDSAEASKKKDKKKKKKGKEVIATGKPKKEPKKTAEPPTKEKVVRAIKDTTTAKKKQDEKEKMVKAKMVFLVRTDLGMGKGQVAAQVAHAAVDCYINAEESNRDTVVEWRLSGRPKIALKVDSEAELLTLHKRAKNAGLVTALIKDDGRTQIACGSSTVLGIGPNSISSIDAVCGHLKLY